MPSTQGAKTSKQNWRRWLRFSLRGLLVFVTVLCIWFGYETTRARKQSAAVTKLQELGAVVLFDYDYDPQGYQIPDGEPSAPIWLRETLGNEYFRHVVTVDIFNANFEQSELTTKDAFSAIENLPDLTTLGSGNNQFVTDADLVHISHLKKLRTLYLHRMAITGSGLRYLRGMKELQGLTLQDSPVTDEGLKHLQANLALTGLHLGDTQITDEGLRHLAPLISLKTLNLSYTAVTDAGLEILPQLAGLTSLSIAGTRVTDAGLEHLGQLPNLRELDVHNTQVTDKGLAQLTGLSKLEVVYAKETRVTSAGVEELKKSLPKLRVSW